MCGGGGGIDQDDQHRSLLGVCGWMCVCVSVSVFLILNLRWRQRVGRTAIHMQGFASLSALTLTNITKTSLHILSTFNSECATAEMK